MSDKKREKCPACRSSNRVLEGLKNSFEIFDCADCRTVYTGSLPQDSEKEDYDSYYSEANLSTPDFLVARLIEIIGEFRKYRKEGRLLDIGFGAGTLLEVAQNEGWQVFGLEVSKPAVEQARSKGFEVFHGSLSEANYPQNHFDVITASEILEHLESPIEELREIFRILRPGGLLWATTPSSVGISRKAMGLHWSMVAPPEHTQLYSKLGMRIMLRDAGFRNSIIKTHGTNPFEILGHFRPTKAEESGFDRVKTAYALNEELTKTPVRKIVKKLINQSLNLTGLGDSLKIYAIK